MADETLPLHEYSPGFDPERFAAHETFFVEDVRRWARSRFGVALPAERTAVFGVSASGELALALGLRHPEVYGAVFCASPGAGYRPPDVMPSTLPRAYLVAGTLEPFFHENATRWAEALRDAGADVVMTERVGSHDDTFWREEFPLTVAARWAAWPAPGVRGHPRKAMRATAQPAVGRRAAWPASWRWRESNPRPSVPHQGFSERILRRFSRPRQSCRQAADGLSRC